MNWTLALPEIVLACVGMATLIFGVLRKQDSTSLCTMFTIGGYLVAALLVLTRSSGFGFHGQFVADPFSGEPGTRMYRSGDLGRYLARDDVDRGGAAALVVDQRILGAGGFAQKLDHDVVGGADA